MYVLAGLVLVIVFIILAGGLCFARRDVNRIPALLNQIAELNDENERLKAIILKKDLEIKKQRKTATMLRGFEVPEQK